MTSLCGICALVPVKRFGAAKTRLAAVLGPAERSRLAQAMLCDVLDALCAARGLDGILVVTSDTQAAAIARAHGCEVLGDPFEAGTNAAVRCGLHHLDAAGCAGVLVVPGDVPFIAAAEIEAALAALRRSPVVLAPAHRDGGTNLLGLMPPHIISTSFGPDSLAGHVAAARHAGIKPAVLPLQGAGDDIDVPADLVAGAFAGGPGRRTRALIASLAGVGFPAAAGCFQELSP